MIKTCPRYSRNLIREGEVRVKYETNFPADAVGGTEIPLLRWSVGL